GDRRACCAAVLALCLLLALPAAAQEDPADEVESWNVAIGARLALLRESLEGAEGSWTPPEGLLAADLMLPSESQAVTPRHAGPGWTLELVTNGAPEARPASQLASQLLAEWIGTSDRRIELKVIGVDPGAGSLHATVLVHAIGLGAAGPLQRNSTWELTWRTGDGPEPVLVALAEEHHEVLRGGRALFEEVTGSVLDPSSGSTRLTAYGCDQWVRRIDRVGEPHWFGHNGIALGDVNGDGLEDLYLAMGTGVPNLLLLRRPDGTLEERGQAAGVAWLDDTKGVLLLDFDGDGDKDLLAAIGPALVLHHNDGDGVFTPASSLQAESPSPFYSLAAADFDLDGDLDIYALRYVQSAYGQSIPRPFQDARNGPGNHLLRNDGPEGFVDVTAEVGLSAGNDRFSLAASWVDYDRDGDPDLYVANDFGRNNFYRNDDGRFVDVAAELGIEDQAAGMGVSWADVDRDGDLDLHVSNMFSSAGLRVAYLPGFKSADDAEARSAAQRHAQGNSLFLNGAGGFEEVGGRAGIRMGRWSWGGRFVDLDGNGHQDLVVPNGFMTNDREDDL
ncbi:MAG: VCBS repeat-containing protein, partial [Planctomycetota bacterium]|nr:VCBS repeat-containing protein [Planctomycetota bacterium]